MNALADKVRQSWRSLPYRIPVVMGMALVLAGAGWTASTLRQQRPMAFPHQRHEGLFPLCTGCHEGIPNGDSASFFPSPEVCARCHDGSLMPQVSYTPPTLPPTNLRFDHNIHPAYLEMEGDSALACEACHVQPGGLRMEVLPAPRVQTCLSCHAHKATEHQVDADCSTCHLPLAQSGFSLSQIEAIQPPPDHAAANFLAGGHGVAAGQNSTRCATCHTQDRCVACHVDTDRKEIQAIPRAPGGMQLPAASAHYPTPATHTDEGWLGDHGTQASRTACATCHTRNDCQACHLEPLPKQVKSMPTRDEVVAPGVEVTPRPPESHKSMFFMKTHSTLAASDGKSCATCHEEAFCVSCHDGPSQGGYHPAGFVAKHPADAFGRAAECSNCHNTTVFCRACHMESGLTSHGRLGGSYHDAQPLWLLRHGQAARETLESCTSCHKQSDCTQCHGVLGAFKVNPHGADFDAERAWRTNPRPCTFCHIKNPLEGGGQ